jgi:pyruvate formate-lyase activating enzyme-like uncharacterized protein
VAVKNLGRGLAHKCMETVKKRDQFVRRFVKANNSVTSSVNCVVFPLWILVKCMKLGQHKHNRKVFVEKLKINKEVNRKGKIKIEIAEAYGIL